MLRNNDISLKIFFTAWMPILINWIILALEPTIINVMLLHYNIRPEFIINFNVAYTFLFLVEAPVIMLNIISISLISDYYSYIKVLKSAVAAISASIILFSLFLYSKLFSEIFSRSSNEIITNYTHIRQLCLLILIIAIFIGYKRIFQGILFAHYSYGTILYISFARILITVAFLTLHLKFLPKKIDPDFAVICILGFVTLVESLLTHFFSRTYIKKLSKAHLSSLSYRRIFRFFYPLSLTSLVSLVSFPVLTFFMILFAGHASELLSFQLAFFIVSPFKNVAMSLQEVLVLLLKKCFIHLHRIRKYCIYIAAIVTGILITTLVIPLTAHFFFQLINIPNNSYSYINQLSCILFLYPLTTFIVIWQRSLHICSEKTRIFTIATIAEFSVVIGFALSLYFFMGVNMGICGSIALVLGRCVSILFLVKDSTLSVRGLP